MAIKASDLANMTDEEIMKLFSNSLATRCKCGNLADKDYFVKEEPSCEDCYFDLIGEKVSYHPIVLPRKPSYQPNTNTWG